MEKRFFTGAADALVVAAVDMSHPLENADASM
jgi:hypothetical protein